MTACLFCQIVDGHIPCTEVYASQSVLAFRDMHPKAPAHILVIPKAHYATLNDLPVDSDIARDITVAIQTITRELGIHESGYRVIINTNDDGGQEVGHVHWHILGGAPVGPMVSA